MTPLVRRCAAPLSLAVAAGLLVAAPAQAAPTWLAPVDIQSTSGEYPDAPLVGVDATGNATAVWVNYTSDVALVTSDHPVGGTWSAPAPLSALGFDDTDFDLAVGASGDAVAAWVMPGATDDVIEASHRAPGGAWSAPVAISTAGDDAVRDVQVGMDAAGNALAVWDARDSLGDSYIASSTAARNAAWSGVVPLSTGDSTGQPEVAVAPDGAATVVWSQFSDDFGVSVVRAASRTSAGVPFGGGGIISPTDTSAGGPFVAVNAAGAASAAWSQDLVAEHGVIRAAVRPAGGSWSSSQQISADSDPAAEQDDVSVASMVVDTSGAPTLVWGQRVDTPSDPGPGTDTVRTVHAASGTAGGAWSAPETLGDLSGLGRPSLTVDGSGTATTVWREDGRPVLLARRPAGGAWSSPLELETRPDVTTYQAAVAADPAGNVVALWSAEPDFGDNGLMRARAFDVDGPLVSALSIPVSGTAGTPVAFSVTAVDAWSAVASTTWSFGDGTTGSGAAVSHTYASAGSYAVSVTVTDAVGNARTRTGTTVVAAAPVVTPPAATPKPKLTGVKLTEKTIHVKGSDESPKATKLKLTLNTDAKVKVVLKRTKKVDGKVVKAAVTKALTKGSSAIKLTSKVGSKKLPPGSYKVTVSAKNSVGTSVAVVLKLTIVA